MDFNPIILSIPIFFGLMSFEIVYEALSGKHTYRLNDAITNINLGVLNQITNVAAKVVTVGVFAWFHEYASITQLEPGTLNFIVLFILYDLCFYWSHRMAHEISLFWGGHVVHHQSEDFNLSVALRQSSTAFIWSIPFYVPLAVLGFDPMQFLLIAGLNLVYQFWIHTEHVGKLGILEYVMNTPSHHRVHHGRNPKYIDKNYAGVFIVWDRIFGTFQEEEERPQYGITKPLNSWNPVYANIAHYLDLYAYAKQARSFSDAFNIMFKHPGWLPGYLADQQETKSLSDPKYNMSVSYSGTKIYIFIQFIASTIITAYFLFSFDELPVTLRWAYIGWIVYSTFVFGMFFENHPKIVRILELVRMLLLAGIIYLQFSG